MREILLQKVTVVNAYSGKTIKTTLFKLKPQEVKFASGDLGQAVIEPHLDQLVSVNLGRETLYLFEVQSSCSLSSAHPRSCKLRAGKQAHRQNLQMRLCSVQPALCHGQGAAAPCTAAGRHPWEVKRGLWSWRSRRAMAILNSISGLAMAICLLVLPQVHFLPSHSAIVSCTNIKLSQHFSYFVCFCALCLVMTNI